ncbi:hypothetical protein HYR65_02110 [Candidatus Azambacteria bacterium]|nr:hypothetical protein [Candidatus Azambacteria bacterium]
MFDEVKKILQTLKKGVVVMENGKPSYVVVPFEEFERVANENEKNARLSPLREASPIDDASLIQKMIAHDSGAENEGSAAGEDDAGIKSVLDALDREKEMRASAGSAQRPAEEGIRDMNLEDLPF